MKLKELNENKILKYIIALVAGVLYIGFVTWLCSFITIDSDKANHLLQAYDIVHGNLFLEDWYMTGITFWTTDLIFYELAAILAGISRNAIYIAGGLMVSTVTLVSFYSFLDIKDEYNKLRKILFIFLLGIPSSYLLLNSRVHAGAIVCSFLAIKLVDTISKLENISFSNRKTILILFGLLLFVIFGVEGDKLSAIEGVLPILIFCLYKLLVDANKSKNHIIALSTTILGTILGIGLEKAFFIIGGAERNSYLNTVEYSSLYDWELKVTTLIEILSKFLNGNYYEYSVGEKWALFKLLSFAVLVIALIVFIRTLVIIVMRKAEEKNVDAITFMLSFSAMLSMAAFIFTGNSHAKYIAVIPYALLVVLLRNIKLLLTGFKNIKLWIAILLMVSFAIFIGDIHDMQVSNQNCENERDEVIGYLKEKNLTNGYAAFWNAASFTIDSNNEIKVRHIKFENGFLQPFNWFCKSSWYNEEAKFVIVFDPMYASENQYMINDDSVRYICGEPVEKIQIGKYIIYEYDYDISTRLLK